MTAGSRAVVAIAVTAALALAPTSARAQSAEAEALFREGRQLLKRGDIAAACEKFAASDRLETSVGTLLNLGDCRERLGAVASAWAAFRKAEALAKHAAATDRRGVEAGRRADTLEPRLPHLIIQVPTRADGLTVRRDGEDISPAGWGTPLPIDPGQHVIAAEAPGRTGWHTTVVIPQAAQRRIVMVPELAVVSRPASRQVVTATTPVRRDPPRERVSPGTWTTTRKISLMLGAGGVAALGTGTYFGVLARSREADADARCPATACADPEALRLNRSAHTAATRANILLGIGGGAVATSVVLWFVGSPESPPKIVPTLEGDRVGVSYAGRF